VMTGKKPYPVALVLDTAFGTKLGSLSEKMHVWIVDTPTNRSMVEEIWRTDEKTEGPCVTTFKALPDESAEQMCMRIIPVIEEHHDEYSVDGPYDTLEVIGLTLTEQLILFLKDFGFRNIEETKEGFRASLDVDVTG
jgi:hypothetical protein